jgi:yjeF N-terminal region
MLTADRMAAVDANAAALGVPRKQLMESSGNAVAQVVRDHVDPDGRVVLVCGRGNNGGDAFVTARFLAGYATETVLLGEPEQIGTEIARENWAALQDAELPTTVASDTTDIDELGLDTADCVVDAMLGTGVTGALREPEASTARAINAADTQVISVDVPSGVDADTGTAAGVAVDADHVVTFHDTKPGLANSTPKSPSRISASRRPPSGSSARVTSSRRPRRATGTRRVTRATTASCW